MGCVFVKVFVMDEGGTYAHSYLLQQTQVTGDWDPTTTHNAHKLTPSQNYVSFDTRHARCT